ncbi:MAG: hypothetical protein NVS4B6_15680 [Mycobacterium sp.]
MRPGVTSQMAEENRALRREIGELRRAMRFEGTVFRAGRVTDQPAAREIR